MFADEGLMRSRKQTKYSFEKMISVVELYISSDISYQDLTFREGISNPSMIANWVNRSRAAGPNALKSRRKDSIGKTLTKKSRRSFLKSERPTRIMLIVEWLEN